MFNHILCCQGNSGLRPDWAASEETLDAEPDWCPDQWRPGEPEFHRYWTEPVFGDGNYRTSDKKRNRLGLRGLRRAFWQSGRVGG